MLAQNWLERNRRGGLCRSCCHVFFEVVNTRSPNRCMLHQDIQSLITSSAFCRSCALVSHSLRNAIKTFTQRGMKSKCQEICILPHDEPGKLWIRTLCLKLGELQLFAYPDPVARRLKLPVAYLKAEAITLPLLAKTLDNCIHKRELCNRSTKKLETPEMLVPLLPKRVIDIGDSARKEISSVRLHVSTPDERAFYVTLSHRWGESIPSKTTKANFSSQRKGINYNDLPTTFKDAIFTTNKMGIRYLWIDALCIIQDDYEDWTSQAPQMGSIFQYSTCTIAAHSAKDTYNGFLFAEEGNELVEISQAPRGSIMSEDGTVFVGPPRRFDEARLKSHIMTRGWVQQELILSRRLLHFFSGLAYWECPHTNKPEPLGFESESYTTSTLQIHGLKNLGDITEESWIRVVEHYSTCTLTYESDRLVAIEGLASIWMKYLNSRDAPQYRYGHFIRSAESLLWAVADEQDSKTTFVPSWSWASVRGPVQFMGVRSAIASSANQTRLDIC